MSVFSVPQNVDSLLLCWRINFVDGSIYYFTSHSSDVVYGGITYKASVVLGPGAVNMRNDLVSDSFDVEFAIDNDLIREDDILSGKYDGATVACFMLGQDGQKIDLGYGLLSGVKIIDGESFVAVIKSNVSLLKGELGEQYSTHCRADLGDSRCGVDLSQYRHIGSVEFVDGANVFGDNSITQRDDYYSLGTLRFMTGLNAGMSCTVRRHSQNKIVLNVLPRNQIMIGDNYEMFPGCDKGFMACRDKFRNILNFRGEPAMPADRVLSFR